MSSAQFSSLWDGFEPVVAKINREQKSLKDLSVFFQKRAEIEEAYAKSLKKLAASFKVTEPGYLNLHRVLLIYSYYTPHNASYSFVCTFIVLTGNSTIGDALLGIKEEADFTAESHFQFVSKVKEEVFHTLDSHLHNTKKVRDKLFSAGQNMTKELANSKIAESRSKDKYYKLAESSRGNDKMAKKVDEAKDDYAKKVGFLRQAQKKYFDDMPNLLTELQRFDTQSLETLKSVVDKYTIAAENLPSGITESVSKMKRRIGTFDIEKDMVSFVNSHYTGEDFPPPAKFIMYGADPSTVPDDQFGGYNSSPTPLKKSASSTSLSSFLGRTASSPNMAASMNRPSSGTGASSGSGSLLKSPSYGHSFGKPPSSNNSPGRPDRAVLARTTRISALFKSPPKYDDTVSEPEFQWEDPVEQPADSNSEQTSGPNTYVGYRCRALFDWVAQDEGYLTIHVGDEFDITEDDHSGWFVGTNQRGETGAFPSNYIEFI